jgi:hypothetical protein
MASPKKWSTQILYRRANVKTSTDKSERNEAIDKLDWRLLADVNNTNKNIAAGIESIQKLLRQLLASE